MGGKGILRTRTSPLAKMINVIIITVHCKWFHLNWEKLVCLKRNDRLYCCRNKTTTKKLYLSSSVTIVYNGFVCLTHNNWHIMRIICFDLFTYSKLVRARFIYHVFFLLLALILTRWWPNFISWLLSRGETKQTIWICSVQCGIVSSMKLMDFIWFSIFVDGFFLVLAHNFGKNAYWTRNTFHGLSSTNIHTHTHMNKNSILVIYIHFDGFNLTLNTNKTPNKNRERERVHFNVNIFINITMLL